MNGVVVAKLGDCSGTSSCGDERDCLNLQATLARRHRHIRARCTMGTRVAACILAATLMQASAAAAAECDDAYDAMKGEVRQWLADARDANPSAGGVLSFVWVTTGEAFELAAKLHNADEDITDKRLSCVSQSFTQSYEPVPSFTPNPPPGYTLSQIQALLENARLQVEGELADLDGSYLPCSTCMTSTEQALVLGPLAGFSSAVLNEYEDEVEPKNAHLDCDDWCRTQQTDYNNGVPKHCDTSTPPKCAAVPGRHALADERLHCGPAGLGTSRPGCRAEIRWNCGPMKAFPCKVNYDEKFQSEGGNNDPAVVGRGGW